MPSRSVINATLSKSVEIAQAHKNADFSNEGDSPN